MALIPFSLAHIVLTPRRVRLPGEAVLQPPLERGSDPLLSRWSARLTLKAKSLRPRSFVRVSHTKSPVDEMGTAIKEVGQTE